MLGVLERMKATSVAEVVEADIVRESAKASLDQRAVNDSALASAISEQGEVGWYGEVAEGRAAMSQAGLDPDDPDAVLAWNARFGEMHN